MSRQSTFEIAPAAIAAIRGIEKYVADAGLDKIHYKLIKIRASQLNGCAYCLNMHTRQARELGLSEQRIYLLNAWREAGIYSEEEQAILALTEEMTQIAQGGVTDAVYGRAVELLGETYVKAVMMGIVAINAWNRIVITDHLPLD